VWAEVFSGDADAPGLAVGSPDAGSIHLGFSLHFLHRYPSRSLDAALSFQHESITRIVFADLNGFPDLVALHPKVCTAGSIGLQ
jgi:hypothetical protein